MINYDYYRVFYCVGEYKNITRAAAALNTSQPAVTRVIHKLEDALGCTLFIRTKTGVEFTDEGQLLFEHVRMACQQLIRGEEDISQSLSLDRGIIRISATVTALNAYLFDTLDTFRERYPKIRFIISTSSSDKTIGRLKSGESDLAFVTTPFTRSKGLYVLTVGSFHDILIAGKHFFDKPGKELSLKALEQYPFVCLAKGTQFRQFVDEIFAGHGFMVAPDIELDSVDLVVPMVAHNWGFSIVPDAIARSYIIREEVFEFGLTEQIPERKVCMLSDPSRSQNRATKEFVQFVKGH